MFEPSQLRLTPFGYSASHPSVVTIVVCCLLLPTKDILPLWIPANLSEVGTSPFLCQIYARSTPTWPRPPLEIARDDQQVLQNNTSRGLSPADPSCMAQCAPPDCSWRPTGAPELPFSAIFEGVGQTEPASVPSPKVQKKDRRTLLIGPERPSRLLVTTSRCSKIALPEASDRRTLPCGPERPSRFLVATNRCARAYVYHCFKKGWDK